MKPHFAARNVVESRVKSALFLICLVAQQTPAANWPQWRGPSFNGSTTEAGLPATFSKTNNVKWVVPLPGSSAATPIIWEDKVLISSTEQRSKTLQALCLDRMSGKLLWKKEAAVGFSQDDMSNFASPSPVTDGRVAIFCYGTGDLVAYDFEGRQLWSRNLQKDYGQFAYQWTYGASPLLYGGKLFIQVLQRDVPVHGRGRKDGPNESYLLALDPTTGREQWRHVRPSDAMAESHEAYSTPTPFVVDGRTQLLIVGGDCISGHDIDGGKEIWRWGTWNPTRITHWRLVPSVTAADGVALACGPKNSPVYAVKLGLQGTLDDSGLRWVSAEREISSDVCTPLFYQEKLFILNGDRKTIARVDPKTGKSDWIGELGTKTKIESSPTGADGKIYFMDHRGEVFVVEAGDKFNLLHRTPMGDEGDNRLRSTIAAAQGNLFIRTDSKLYCIGN